MSTALGGKHSCDDEEEGQAAAGAAYIFPERARHHPRSHSKAAAHGIRRPQSTHFNISSHALLHQRHD